MLKAIGGYCAICLAGIVCSDALAGESGNESGAQRATYVRASSGTRQFEWDTNTGTGWIKVLVEEANLGSTGYRVAPK